MDDIVFTSASILIPYSGSQLTNKTIYVRISASAPAGLITGAVTNSGGSAADAIVPINGSVARNYYNTKANLGLTNPNSWSTTLDGSGASPSGMNEEGQVFNIVNPANLNFSGVWDVAAINSRIIIGDGVTPVTFIIPAGADYITAASKIDVLNNASLKILNNNIPALNLLADGSTVEFAESGTTPFDEIRIPSQTYYNLKLTGGIKILSGTTTVKNDFIADAVVKFKGLAEPSTSILNSFGNVSFLNGTVFDDAATKIILKMNGSGPVQNIISDIPAIKLYTLERDSVAADNIILSAGTNIDIYKRLLLQPANTTLSTSGGKISFVSDAIIVSGTNGKIASNGTSFEVLSSTQGLRGTLRFTPGSTIKNLTIDFNPGISNLYDNITIANNVDITGALVLNSGRVILVSGVTLKLTSTATVTGGSSISYIDGALQITGNANLLFPVGNGYHKYAPVYMGFTSSNPGGTYTVFYIKSGFGNYTIDPATLSTHPDYDISHIEYWIMYGSGAADTLRFYYTDLNSGILEPMNLRIAHFVGGDWDDIGGTPDVSNTTSNGNVTALNVPIFSVFTFAGATSAVVPVKLTSFTATKQDKVVKLTWTTEQEINSKSFIVERSPDQRSWNEVTRLNATGNSTVRLNYTATDYNPAKGINYYRLKSLDIDGKFSYSEIRPVYFGNDVVVLIAPNPANDKVNIYLPGNTGIASVQLFNVSGQLIKTISTDEESIQIDVSHLSKGTYTIKVNGKNINEVRRLVVE